MRGQLQEFFDAYRDDWRRRWGGESAEKDAEANPDDVVYAGMLRRGGLSASEIAKLESGLKGPRFPNAIRDFLEEVACSGLELPWSLRLNSTDGKMPLELLWQAMRSQPDKTLCCIGAVDNAEAALCFRLGEKVVDDAPVWAALETRGAPQVFGPVFSSFDKMLAVLTAALRGGANGDLKRRDPAAYEQLLKQLRAIDPQGFGGEAWSFWQRHV